MKTRPFFGKMTVIWAKIPKNHLVCWAIESYGGADFIAAQELGIAIHHALSLPGKVAPLSAAMAIRDTAYNILQEEGIL